MLNKAQTPGRIGTPGNLADHLKLGSRQTLLLNVHANLMALGRTERLDMVMDMAMIRHNFGVDFTYPDLSGAF